MNNTNTPQDHDLAVKIAALLNQSTQQLDSKTTDKLLTARKEALAHFQEKPARAWEISMAGGLSRMVEPFNFSLRAGFVLLALLVSLAGVVSWHTFSQPVSEIAEIDEGLLTDELPINAYLDKGFESWLKRPSP